MTDQKEDLTSVDYGADADHSTTENILATIDHLANQFLDAEDDVATKQEALKDAQAHLRNLAEVQLPEIMDRARQKKLTTASDLEVKVSDKVTGSLPKERRSEGVSWARKNGHGALVRNVFAAEFEPGMDEASQGVMILFDLISTSAIVRTALLDVLLGNQGAILPDYQEKVSAAFEWLSKPRGNNRPWIAESTIHHSTLCALVRQLLTEGKIDVPTMDMLGVRGYKEASVTRPEG